MESWSTIILPFCAFNDEIHYMQKHNLSFAQKYLDH